MRARTVFVLVLAACQPLAPARADGPGPSVPPAGPGAAKQAASPPAPDAGAGAAAAGPKAVVLASLPVPGDPTRTFELVIAPCRDKQCPLFIALVEAGKTLDRKKLTWASVTQEAAQQDAEGGWGATDPLVPGSPPTAWTTGEEATFLATMIRPLRLGNRIEGVLVNQVAGFEHLKRAHVVFAAVGRDLVEAWSAKEGAGWTFSAATVVPLATDRDGVAYFESVTYTMDSDTQPDALRAEVLAWDERRRKLGPAAGNARAALHAVVLGPFANVRKAKQAIEANRACLGGFSILPARRFPEARHQGIVLVRATANRAAADKLATDSAGCAAGDEVSTKGSKKGTTKASVTRMR
jgi:hypothetical protein